MLTVEDRIVKTGRNRFEIIQPNRTWYLEEFKSGTIDMWIKEIKEVLESLAEDQS